MGQLVGPQQSGFIKGRSISSNIMQSVLLWERRAQVQGAILSLD